MAEARYIYGSAAPKQGFDPYGPAVLEETPDSRFEVVPGGNRSEAQSPAYAMAVKAAKVAIVAIIAFACIGFGRITLASATISEAIEAKELENGIVDMRSTISDMQAEQSSLSNPVRVKSEAVALGMVDPEETYIIELEPDVVVTETDGTLSLTKSIGSIA